MSRARLRSLLLPVAALALVAGAFALAGPAAAHEERPATFPDGTGHRPTYAGLSNPRHRVVCQADSAARIARMKASPLKRRNRELLRECRFHSIQTAINSIRYRHTSVYVLPGVYHELRWANQKRSDYCSHLRTASADPLPASEYIGSISDPNAGQKNAQSNPIALSYYDQRRCAHNLNLIAIFGDRTPRDHSIRCNSRFCGTQIVGTGRRQTDVLIDNQFHKLNGLRADRVGGIYLRNFTLQQAEFNSLYVMETDGFVIDHVTTRGDDEYGILAFASDHGLIQYTNDYYNGDSGIYPGSASDVNGDNTAFPVRRYSIEIRYNRSHHNTLGYSGTAGNSVLSHDNHFYDNATGIATDSLFPGHPGLPQDHAHWTHNVINSNNSNWYTRFVDTGVCDRPMKQRGYLHGTVCPVVPVPVGTGHLIAGGNFDSVDHNWIYDNWRYGTMLFWVPAALRDEYDPQKLYDTSHHDHYVGNHMGIRPDGSIAHNGMDHWWDGEGAGNCWQGNVYSRGHRTDNFVVPVPDCDAGGSTWTPGASVTDAGFLSCNEYDRTSPVWKHPPGCTWFNSPSRPTAQGGDATGDVTGAVPTSSSRLSGPGGAGTGAVLATLVLAGGLLLRRRTASRG